MAFAREKKTNSCYFAMEIFTHFCLFNNCFAHWFLLFVYLTVQINKSKNISSSLNMHETYDEKAVLNSTRFWRFLLLCVSTSCVMDVFFLLQQNQIFSTSVWLNINAYRNFLQLVLSWRKKNPNSRSTSGIFQRSFHYSIHSFNLFNVFCSIIVSNIQRI